MEWQENFETKIETIYSRPTLVGPEKQDVSSDVSELHQALKCITDKKRLIQVLCKRTSKQRVEIAKAYKTCYDKDLIDVVKRKFRGDFLNLLVALITPIHEFYCRELYDSLNGAGTDEEALIQILITLSNRELYDICQRYTKNFGRALEKDLRADTCGNFRKLVVSLSNGTRDLSNVLDLYTARVDALELKRAGIDKWGTDGATFNRILCLRNCDQIRLIAQEYEFVTGHPLEKDIEKEFSGDIERGLLAIVRFSENRGHYFARCLHRAMAGIGTDDKSLIRLIVTRSEIDMLDIKEEFQSKYGKSLKAFISSDTSGSYRKALLTLIAE
jgi:annexin A7/11